MDEQLSAARALLDWLASHPDARALGAYVHPGLAVARDQWGGLSLRVKRTDEVCSALANHVAALGLRRWMGLTPDELVFAIPRELTIAAASSTAQRPVTTGGAASSLDEPPAQPSQTEPYTALAREFAALVAAQQASCRDGAQRPTHTLPRALLSAYLGCLPTPQDLERLLPVLWALQPCLTQTQPQSEADSQAADADAGISDTVKRARWLLGVASVSQALHTALKQQLTLLLQYLPPARRAALEFVLSAAAADASLHEAPQLTPQAPPAHHQQQQQEGAESSSSVPSPASARQLCWAQGLVWSRAIQLWSGPTFVPLADLLNHNHPPNVMCRGATQGEEDEGTACQGGEGGEGPVRKGVQTFECYAVQLLPPGAELHWVYCSHPHDTGWLCGYGFIPSDTHSSSPSPVLPTTHTTSHPHATPPPPHTDDTHMHTQPPQAQQLTECEVERRYQVAIASLDTDEGACEGLPEGLRGGLRTLLVRECEMAVRLVRDAELAARVQGIGCASDTSPDTDTDTETSSEADC